MRIYTHIYTRTQKKGMRDDKKFFLAKAMPVNGEMERERGGAKVKEKKSHLEIFYLATNVESEGETSKKKLRNIILICLRWRAAMMIRRVMI